MRHAEPPRQVTELAEQLARDGGQALATYRDPVGDHWQIFCLLPLEKVEPTPYQRDLSRAHVQRLHEVVRKIGRFVDPIVVTSPRPGVYWTPNGNHRRAVLGKLKARSVPAILVPEREVAFQILALNTEKTHNLKEKSLEVIRRYRVIAVDLGDRGGAQRVDGRAVQTRRADAERGELVALLVVLVEPALVRDGIGLLARLLAEVLAHRERVVHRWTVNVRLRAARPVPRANGRRSPRVRRPGVFGW